MVLELMFAGIILFNGCDSEESGNIKLVQIFLKAPIIDMICTQTWSRVLILVASVFFP